MRQNPSSRKKFVLFRKSSLHLHEISSQIIFSGNDIHAWILIDFLPWLHFAKKISSDAKVMERNVPVSWQFLVALAVPDGSIMILLIFLEAVVQYSFGNSSNDIVFCTEYIYHIFSFFVRFLRFFNLLKNVLNLRFFPQNRRFFIIFIGFVLFFIIFILMLVFE